MERLLTPNQMRLALARIATPHGLAATFAAAKLGKTALTEGLVSEAHRLHPRDEYSVNMLPEVVDAVSRTWLSPRCIHAAVQNGILTSETATSSVAGFLALLKLDSEAAIQNRMFVFQGTTFPEIEARAKLANSEADYANFDFVKQSAREGSAGHIPYLDECLLIRPNNSGTLRGTTRVVCVDGDGRVSLIKVKRLSTYKSGDDIPLGLLEEVHGKYVKDNFFSGDGATLAVTVPLDESLSNAAEIKSAMQKSQAARYGDGDDDALSDEEFENSFDAGSIDWLERELSDNTNGGVVDAYAEVIFTKNGVSLAHSFDGEVDDADYSLDDVPGILSAMRASVKRTFKAGSTIDDLIEKNPMAMYEILLTFGVVSHVILTDTEMAGSLGEALQVLVGDLHLRDAPVLIETEDKASTTYGGIARNASLEDRLTNIEIVSDRANFNFGVVESLTLATVGSIFISPVVHVSVLDLTMIYDMAVKTTTRKGGLDSAQLNILQYLSGIARRAGATIFAETRDDFFAGVSDSEVGARDTLGANSRIAIRITESDAGSNVRNVWVRVKGYDDYQDAEFECANVGRDDYPDSFLRVLKDLPDFLEGIA